LIDFSEGAFEMATKVSLRDVAMTVNDFEGTVRAQLGQAEGGGEVLAAIDTIRQALNDIGARSDTSDQIFCISDQIICGRKNGNA
jgi:hypothetical protein